MRVLTKFLIALATITPPVLSASVSSAADHNEAMTPTEICEDFVRRLVADDYALFFSLEPGPFFNVLFGCTEALEEDPENPVFMVGKSRALDLGEFYLHRTDEAIDLLRKAAEQNYEPALVQLLRYLWQDRFREDPFLKRIRFLRVRIDDDPILYVDALKDSSSGRVHDLVLGMIVVKYLDKRFDVARSLAATGLERNSAIAIFNYGMMHLGGYGVERDKAKGLELLRTAARMGDNEAQVQFAYLSWGVPLDGRPRESDDFYIDKFKYLTRAAVNGHDFALILLPKLVADHVRETEEATGEARVLGETLLEVIACNLDADTRLRLSFVYLTPTLPDLETALPECRTEAFRSTQ